MSRGPCRSPPHPGPFPVLVARGTLLQYAVKAQTWIATSGYVLVAILTKDLSLDWGFGEILRILGRPHPRGCLLRNCLRPSPCRTTRSRCVTGCRYSIFGLTVVISDANFTPEADGRRLAATMRHGGARCLLVFSAECLRIAGSASGVRSTTSASASRSAAFPSKHTSPPLVNVRTSAAGRSSAAADR